MTDAGSLRSIPAVEKILQELGETGLPRPLVVSVVRQTLAALRQEPGIPSFPSILHRIRETLETHRLSRIQPVINGAGILIHTNLGRAPLPKAALETLHSIGAGYSNLEFDLASGERGHRAGYLEKCLALLCDAEAAAVVNNCAAALVLILRCCAREPRPEVLISRGELIQIGGGFRIPEILEASGAKLREVGATNKTDLQDYERALSPRAGLILKVHQSNFYMDGFVAFPSAKDLAALARRAGIPFVEDLGSGAVIPSEQFPGLPHEPMPGEILRNGADLVCFSGDKFLGGPQAGIIAGRQSLIDALKKEPFFRALRCDKLILSALQTTVELYLNNPSIGSSPTGQGIPILEMLQTPVARLRARGLALIDALSPLPVQAQLAEGRSQIGGGALARAALPSALLELVPCRLRLPDFAQRLRRGPIPVIGYIQNNRFDLDLRAISPDQDAALLQMLALALNPPPADNTPALASEIP